MHGLYRRAMIGSALLAVLMGLGALAAVSALSAASPGGGPAAPTAHVGLSISPLKGEPNSVIASINIPNGPSSGAAIFDPTDAMVYLGAGGTNLTALNGTTNTIQRSWYLGPYANPETPTFVAAADRIFVPQQSSGAAPDNVTAINLATGAWIANISTGNYSTPAPATYDPVHGTLYVPDYGAHNVTVINVTTAAVIATIPVGQFPFTPAYDPADGDMYVPNTVSGNVSVISTATNKVVATFPVGTFPFEGSETAITGQPVYDPVSQEVYQPNPASSNLSVMKGTTFVENLSVGPGMGTPMVDPTNGYLFIPIDLTSVTLAGQNNTLVIVNPTTNTVVTNLTVGYGPNTPVYDPANQEVYVSNTLDDTVSAVNATTYHVDATIDVGVNPDGATYDSANEEIYVPNPVSNNVSVIAAGPIPKVSTPGSYTVTFTETGLPAGAWWNVALGGTTLNQTSSSISFYSVVNGTYSYAIGPWDDASTCQFQSITGGGTVVVAGAGQTVTIPFVCGSSPLFPTTPGPTLFLGLAGIVAYLVIGAILIVVVIVVVVVVLVLHSRPPTPPPYAPPAGGMPPPGAMPPGYYAPPPPPPPPAPGAPPPPPP